MTSSALKSRLGVKSAVVWNFAPRRRLKVYSRPSSDTDQLSARAGTMLVVPRSNSTSRLYTARDDASNVVPAVYSDGLTPSGLPSEQNTRVLAARAAGEMRSPSVTAVLIKVRFMMISPLMILRLPSLRGVLIVRELPAGSRPVGSGHLTALGPD